MATPSLRYAISGLGGLRPVMKQVAGVEVRYHSVVDGQVYDVRATLDDAAGEVESIEGNTISFHLEVFKIDVADLPVMPQRLDRIEWKRNKRTEWFQVLSDSSIDHVAPNGNFRDTWRINTKWIPSGEETVQTLYGNQSGIAYGNADPEGTGYGSARR